MLTCPLCGDEMDPRDPGVASRRSEYDQSTGPAGEWLSTWAPFIEDLRGTPQRLVHPECFVDEAGVSALVQLVHERDVQRRQFER